MIHAQEEHPLEEVVYQWLQKIKKGVDDKAEKFQDVADECMKFYTGRHDFLYEGGRSKKGAGFYVDAEDKIRTTFRMTVCKPAEMVQLFGPYLYHRNPNRMVTPRKPDIPNLVMMLGAQDPQYGQFIQQQFQQRFMYNEARGQLLQFVLNYTPNEFGLNAESRQAIDEGMLKGRGTVWTELYYPPDSQQLMVGTFYDSVDNLVTDPDADVPGEYQWIARKCVAPYWELEQEYGLPQGSLKEKATTVSTNHAAKLKSEERSKLGGLDMGEAMSTDLVTYWKIYSKMGMGQHLKGLDDKYKKVLDQFGKHCYLVVVNGVQYPLNLPPHIMRQQIQTAEQLDDLMNRVRWPIPFYADASPGGGWPVSMLDFHKVPGCSWPMAHMKPALGELKAIDWIMSFLLNKVKFNSRDLLAIAEEMAEDGVLKIKEGDDYDTLFLKRSLDQKINEMVQFLQFPPMNRDIIEVLGILMEMFDRRTGLNELLYGMTSTQMRSASEADLKGDMIQIRINDMAQTVEEWQTEIARKEAVATRLFLDGKSVAPIFGEWHDPQNGQSGLLSQLWDQVVYAPVGVQDANALSTVMREFDYRIEAGSIRKPNQQAQMENMDNAAQILVPNLLGIYQATGDPTQLNAFMTDWAKARQFDIENYLFPPMPPPGTPAEELEEQGAQ